MKGKKTIKVEEVKKIINRMIEKGKSTPEARRALGCFLEEVLHQTNNYKGFQYLEWSNGGCQKWEEAGKPVSTTPFLGDQSKVYYF